MKKIDFVSGMRVVYITLMGFFMYINNSYSQGKIIQILDQQKKVPVTNIHYQYGAATGYSGEDGKIRIEFQQNEPLILSHIQIGNIKIDPEQVENAFKTGMLEVAFQAINILPVTVIQVHPDAGEKNNFTIPFQEKLEHDAGQLLEEFSSVSTIRKSGSYGFDPVLRGFKSDQLNLVIDGVQSATAACPNRMDPPASQIPVNMISKVEVLKGPYSLRYGNAFGGTINFKSSSPAFSEKLTPEGRLGTSYESNGSIYRAEGFAGISSPGTDIKLFGAYSKGNDYTDGDGLKVQSDFNRLNWGTKLGFKLGDQQKLGFFASNNRAKNVDFASLQMDLRSDNTWLLNATHSLDFVGKKISVWNTTGYFTHVDHVMDNLSKVLNPRMVNAVTNATTLNYGGRTELRFDFDNQFAFAGADYRFESSEGIRTREMLMGPMAGKTLLDNVWQEAQIQRIGIFGEWHAENAGFHWVISARLDYNAAKANVPAPEFEAVYSDLTSQYLNTSASAGGTKFIGNNMSLGIWLGSAQRSPGISERYINFLPIGLDPYEMVGNPQLKPERNNQADLVFQYQTESTTLNFDFYYSFLRSYISSEIDTALAPRMSTAPGVRRFTNIDKASMYGFETGWKQLTTKYIVHELSLVYTHGNNEVTNEPLPEIPPLEFRYRLTGKLLKNKLVPEILFRQAFKQDRIAVSYGETKTPGFHVVDLKLKWVGVKKLTAVAGVKNVFDIAYYEHLARSIRAENTRPIYSPGRSFYFTLTYNFM